MKSVRSRLVAARAATALLALLFAGTPAFAQWMWKDESGHTIASDQPPPPGTPPARILKSPRTSPAPVPAAPAKPPEGAEPPKSLADRDLEFKQRQKEAAEAQKAADESAAKARALAENCATVRGNLAALQTGGRMARVNERGEKSYIDDNQRAAEIARAQGQVAQFCK